MGYWKSKRGIIGDDYADIMDDCMKKLAKVKFVDKEITLGEFADLIEFCTKGIVKTKINDATKTNSPISKI